jgi:hypothetical protein
MTTNTRCASPPPPPPPPSHTHIQNHEPWCSSSSKKSKAYGGFEESSYNLAAAEETCHCLCRRRRRNTGVDEAASDGGEQADNNNEDDDTLLVLNNRIELKNNRQLNEMLDALKYGVMQRLRECGEPIKAEMLVLCERNHEFHFRTQEQEAEHSEQRWRKGSAEMQDESSAAAAAERKRRAVGELVGRVLHEWRLVNDACAKKLHKLEAFRARIGQLDTRLNEVRETVLASERLLLLSNDDDTTMTGFDIGNYAHVQARKRELEALVERMRAREPETDALFRHCLLANRLYFNANRHTRTLIVSVRQRWATVRAVARERIYKLSHVWTHLCDLSDQMEKFVGILSRTELFYQNVAAVSNKKPDDNNGHNVLTAIEDIYLTIKDDYKLIKYLNESYVNFAKFVGNLDSSSCQRLEAIKMKLLAINSRWDCLHNEIAIKINLVQNFFFILFFLKKTAIFIQIFYFIYSSRIEKI